MPWTLLLPLLLFAQADTVPAFQLQPPGRFHDGETVAIDGETWLALRRTDGGTQLTPTRLAIARVFDPITDDAGQATGWSVEPDDPQVLVFVRGPGLVTGTVVAAGLSSVADPAPAGAARTDEAFLQRIHFAGRSYRLAPRCTRAAEPEASAHCAIDLVDDGGRRQRLATVRGGYRDDGSLSIGSDRVPSLIFAGDLDRDGRLDLILDAADHYNLSRPTLFLSRSAQDGAMLREVASFEAVGC